MNQIIGNFRSKYWCESNKILQVTFYFGNLKQTKKYFYVWQMKREQILNSFQKWRMAKSHVTEPPYLPRIRCGEYVCLVSLRQQRLCEWLVASLFAWAQYFRSFFVCRLPSTIIYRWRWRFDWCAAILNSLYERVFAHPMSSKCNLFFRSYLSLSYTSNCLCVVHKQPYIVRWEPAFCAAKQNVWRKQKKNNYRRYQLCSFLLNNFFFISKNYDFEKKSKRNVASILS